MKMKEELRQRRLRRKSSQENSTWNENHSLRSSIVKVRRSTLLHCFLTTNYSFPKDFKKSKFREN